MAPPELAPGMSMSDSQTFVLEPPANPVMEDHVAGGRNKPVCFRSQALWSCLSLLQSLASLTIRNSLGCREGGHVSCPARSSCPADDS